MANNTTYSKTTPFIRPISVQGGTFYTFSSAGEDFTLSFNENAARTFNFSKFALLNIPEFSDNPDRKEENLLRLTAIPGANKRIMERPASSVNLNNYFAESFQNYCLNLETAVMSRSDYNAMEPKSVSERVFFKWLKEMGAIRFTAAVDATTTGAAVFTEEAEVIENNFYKRVVQYIGDIDLTNNFSGLTNSYNEVFVNIPTEAGNFSQIFFNTIVDDNYYPGMSICRNDDLAVNNSYILGHDYNDYHPIANFDTQAYYDNVYGLSAGSDVLLNTFQLRKADPLISKPTKPSQYLNGTWWFNSTSDKYCYNTEISKFNDPTNEYLALGDPVKLIHNPSTGEEIGFEGWTVFKRSKLDGIQINFEPSTYNSLAGDINSLMSVATSPLAQNFEFNCILIYYDLLEKKAYEPLIIDEDFVITPDDPYSTSAGSTTTSVLATNLFGVLFLDNVNTALSGELTNALTINSVGSAKIPSLTKCIPNKETKLNGNAYGFKLNIKLDVSNVNSGVNVETYISDNKTLSLDIFTEAMNSMYKTSELITDYFYNQMYVDSRLATLEESSNASTANSYAVLKSRLDQIEQYLTQDEIFLQIAEKKDLVDLINENYIMLNSLLNNTTNLNVAFDLGTIREGSGIVINRNAGGIVIESSEVDFNFGNNWKIYPPNDVLHPDEVWVQKDRTDSKTTFYEYEMELKPLRNYIRLTNNDIEFIPKGDFRLKIKDGLHTWRTGQSMRIYFESAYPMIDGNIYHDFYIYTDFGNILGSDKGNYSALMAKITASDFNNRNNKPVMEIHCIDASKLIFIIDFLN